jgi:hypothetical protein
MQCVRAMWPGRRPAHPLLPIGAARRGATRRHGMGGAGTPRCRYARHRCWCRIAARCTSPRRGCDSASLPGQHRCLVTVDSGRSTQSGAFDSLSCGPTARTTLSAMHHGHALRAALLAKHTALHVATPRRVVRAESYGRAVGLSLSCIISQLRSSRLHLGGPSAAQQSTTRRTKRRALSKRARRRSPPAAPPAHR